MNRTQPSVPASPSAVASCAMRARRRRVLYESPRCQEGHDDEHLLRLKESLQTHQDRWNHMSQLAGSHKQDRSVLILTRRKSISPQSLRFGIPPNVAARVRVLHLDLNLDHNRENNDLLPEWMDVLSSLFHQLQHLYLSASSSYDNIEQHNDDAARMRRLYVLYRLPDLRSIDGTVVTEMERQLARPSTPNGHKVKRAEWISTVALMDSDDSDSDDDESDDNELGAQGEAIEVSLDGCIKPIRRVHPEKPYIPEWECPFEPRRVWSTPDILLHGGSSTCQKRKLSADGSEIPELLPASSLHASLVMSVSDPPAMSSDGCGYSDDKASCVSTCGGLSLPYLSSSDNLPLQEANPCPRFRSFSEELSAKPAPKIIPAADMNESKAKSDDNRRPLTSTPVPLLVPSADNEPRDESKETTDLVAKTSTSTPLLDETSTGIHPDHATSADRVIREGPSTSLSSPFPLRFREKSALSNSAPPKLSLATARESLQNVPAAPSSTKVERGESSSIELWVGRDDSTTKSVISPPATEHNEAVSSPDLMERPMICASSPDKTVASRPPTCPASRRQVVPMRGTTKKTKRGLSLWRSRKTARSTSMLDTDEDNDSDDDNDGAVIEEEQDQSEVFVSFLESSRDDENDDANVFVSFREIALNE